MGMGGHPPLGYLPEAPQRLWQRDQHSQKGDRPGNDRRSCLDKRANHPAGERRLSAQHEESVLPTVPASRKAEARPERTAALLIILRPTERLEHDGEVERE